MIVRFYNFEKRTNSTKTPADTDSYLEIDMQSVDGINLLAPSFIVTNDKIALDAYNYAYIPKWNRYYFINGWALAAPFSVVSLTIDVAGSWATAIKNSTQFVERCADKNNADGSISDSLVYQTNAPLQKSKTASVSGWNASYAAGTYVISTCGAAGTSTAGSNVFYALTPANFYAMTDYLFNGISWMNISAGEISEALQKALLNPLQYITSCRWYPFTVSGGAVVTSIPVGYWSIEVNAQKIPASGVYTTSGVIQIDWPTQSTLENRSYLRADPYTRIYFTLRPFCVSMELPASTLFDCNYLHWAIAVDFASGIARLVVNGRTDATADDTVLNLVNVNTNFGVNVPIAQQTNSLPSQSQLIVSAIGGVAEAAKALGV